MIRNLLVLLAVGLLVGCGSEKDSAGTGDTATVAHIDSAETYYVGLIYSHPDREQLPEEEVQLIQKQHLDNIGRLARAGELALAGPFWTEDNSHQLRGLFWYTVGSQEEADSLAATDPAVQKKRLAVISYPWTGSAGMTYDTIAGAEGMRGYQAAVFWRTDPADSLPNFDTFYEEHNAAIMSACDTCRIVMAGPFGHNEQPGDPYAMFIYSTDTLSTVEDVVATMPEIGDSTLTATVINWYGPTGLRE